MKRLLSVSVSLLAFILCSASWPSVAQSNVKIPAGSLSRDNAVVQEAEKNSRVDCESLILPIKENFEGEIFPSECWTNNPYGTPWKRVSSGTNPTCTPQEGGNMIMFEGYGAKLTSAILTSPAFKPEGKDKLLSFWMYRDASLPSAGDKLDIYCTPTTDIWQQPIIISINRNMDKAPFADSEGWHNYVVTLPCAAMEKAYISFSIEIMFTSGANIYIDNINIADAGTLPPQNVTASVYDNGSSTNNIKVAWEPPTIVSEDFTGYNVYRNGTLVADNIKNPEYIATGLSSGDYVYCVAAVYDREDEPVSEQICASSITITVSCESVPVPIKENFEGETFPSECWINNPYGTPWKRVSSGTNPACTPQEGENMMMFEGYGAMLTSAVLTSPVFKPEGKDKLLSFWMYRDASLPSAGDKVDIYCTPTSDIWQQPIIASINRNMDKTPFANSEGWHNYIVTLPCAAMEKACVTFNVEIMFTSGANIYIDNINILEDYSIPPESITASIYKDGNSDNNIKVSWTPPSIQSGILTGYNIYRNGNIVADNIDVLEYLDMDLPGGVYTYCVSAVYDKEEEPVSQQICTSSIVIIAPCDGYTAPADLTARTQALDWYDVSLTWKDPASTEAFSYVVGDAIGGVGGGQDFKIAVRFTPADLAPYNGQFLSNVNFPANEAGINYVVKVWKGGSDFNAGEEVYSQMVATKDLQTSGYVWNSIKLDTPVEIDASREMWIGVSFEGGSTGRPAVRDGGPILKEGYSNLVYYGDTWTTSYTLNPAIEHNWCLTGIVKEISSTEEPIGYNIYRDDELLNTSGLVSSMGYIDSAPDKGSYSYGVSSVYENHCASEPTTITVVLEESPCETLATLPLKEPFEEGRFPGWCWENITEMRTPWKRVYIVNGNINPHFGIGMLEFPVKNGNNATALYASPPFSGGKACKFSFWMHRNTYSATAPDKVNIYLSSTTDITGLTPLLTVHRHVNMEPAVSSSGWYQYVVDLNTSGMQAGARVIIEAVDGEGSPIYLDDLLISETDACNPIENMSQTQPREGIVNLSWTSPYIGDVTGYKITRDGAVIANNVTTPYFTDKASVGTHEYCITALYNNSGCTEAAPACYTVEVVKQCDPVPDVTATITATRTVQVNWTMSDAIDIVSYSVYRGTTLLDDVTQSPYIDQDVEAGPHTYSIKVNYNNKECAISEPVRSNQVNIDYCLSPENADATATMEAVTLTWDYDGGTGFYDLIYHEGFNTGVPSDWLNLDRDGDGFLWKGPFYGLEGMCVFSESIYLADTLYPDNWLISPAIELTGKEHMEYYIATYNAEWPTEHYGVYISTTGTDYDDFTLLFEETLTAENTVWQKRVIDLSEYDRTVHLAFRHFDSEFMWTVLLDELKVFRLWGDPSFDIFRDDVLLANTNGAMEFTDETVEEGATYNYCVQSVYNSCTVAPTCKTVTVPTDVSIATDTQESLKAYPNPTTGQLRISNHEAAIGNIQLFDLSGRLLYECRDINNTEFTIDLSEYNEGIYFLNADGKVIKVIKR